MRRIKITKDMPGFGRGGGGGSLVELLRSRVLLLTLSIDFRLSSFSPSSTIFCSGYTATTIGTFYYQVDYNHYQL